MDPTGSALLARLEGTDHRDLFDRFSDFLRPFGDLICLDSHNPNPSKRNDDAPKKKKMKKKKPQSLLRPLAEQFLPFLCDTIYLLQSLLRKKPKEPEKPSTIEIENQGRDTEEEELLAIYGMLLDCLDCISPCLEQNPHTVHLERAKFIRCLESHEKYGKAEEEAIKLLKELQSLLPDPKIADSNSNNPKMITTLLVELIRSLACCACKSQTKDPVAFHRVLELVDQIHPWLQFVDLAVSKRYCSVIVNSLYKCAVFLATEGTSFDRDLVPNFCTVMLKECAKSSMDRRLPEIAGKICSFVDLNWDGGPLLDVIQSFMREHEVSPELASILTLYATGLHFKSETQSIQSKEDIYTSFLNSREIVKELNNSLTNLSRYYPNRFLEDSRNNSMSYLDALTFVCKPLIQLANEAWKYLSSESKEFADSSEFGFVLNVLRQFTGFTIAALRSRLISEGDRGRILEKHETLHEAMVAQLKISFLKPVPCEKILSSINDVLSSNWISPEDLRFFIKELRKMGLTMCNTGRLELAQKALTSCCEATWANVRHFRNSQLADPKSIPVNNTPEDSIKNILVDSFSRVKSIICTLHKCGCSADNLSDIVVCTLFELSGIDLHGNQSDSSGLVKQWVKILCKDYEGVDKADDAPVLHSLLKKYKPTWPKKSLGRILEQELVAYSLMEAEGPILCKKMHQKVIDILLNEIYNEKEYNFERSRVLVRKARALRARGLEGLNGSLVSLSDAIDLLKDILVDSSKGDDASVYHLLATTYCLHAQCAQDANLDFEVISQDICSGLDIWSRIEMESYLGKDSCFNLVLKNTIPLLCSMIDLLSLKGCFKFHSDICKLMIKIWTRENKPVEKLFALLWADRRLGHTFCGIPVDLDLLSKVPKDFGIDINKTDYWIRCLKDDCSQYLCLFLWKVLQSDSVFTDLNKPGFDEVKKLASSLASESPLTGRSAFVAGYLYYDLSQHLLSRGQIFEALAFAREALELRKKVLRMNFTYSLGDSVHIEAVASVVVQSWPNSNMSDSTEDSILTPWIVLRCFLDSISQVADIYESTGNGVEAEILFLTGKKISHVQGLPTFEIAFTCLLAQSYRKRESWDAAENELNSARKLLEEHISSIHCKKCEAILETTVNLQYGDLSRSLFVKSSRDLSTVNLSDALDEYESSEKKLNNTKIQFPKINDKESEPSACNTCACLEHLKTNTSKCEKTSRSSRSSVLRDQNGTRTRSSRRAVQKKCEIEAVDKINREAVKRTRKKTCPNTVNDMIGCFSCYLMKLNQCESMLSVLDLNWESRRRRFLVRSLLKTAICLGAQGGKNGGPHKVHDKYRQCIFLLLFRSPIQQNLLEDSGNRLVDLIACEDLGDVLSIERAFILYNLSFFLLKKGLSEQSRDTCCSFANVKMSDIVQWLLRAFILSQELPSLVQKVSRLLAYIFLLSKMDFPSASVTLPLHSSKSLSLAHWAAYFHKASLGTFLNSLYISTTYNTVHSGDDGTAKTDVRASMSFRGSFKDIEGLEEHVTCFFRGLPSVPIICFSMLSSDYANLLGETTLLLPSFFPACIMLSRFDSSTGQPITMLLPVDLIPEVHLGDSMSSKELINGSTSPVKRWNCPWGVTVLDYVAPSFKRILNENFVSGAIVYSSDKQAHRNMWWSRRYELNNCLDNLLREVEESWIGPWACLFRGHQSASQTVNKRVTKLINELDTKFKINPSLARAILCGVSSLDDARACISQLVLYGGHFGRGACCGKDRFRDFPTSRQTGSELTESIHHLLQETVCGPKHQVERGPVILVLDTDVQMFPWENLPTLRNQEIYRMPSVESIFLTLNRNNFRRKERDLDSNPCFPIVDLSESYYLLNPGGDFPYTQTEFEQWFRDHCWEGKAGDAPTREELVLALKNHDMFIYFGHGSGSQYISEKDIEKLEHCAATLLMGCSSGSLTCKGSYSYAPQGIALSYLFAGSPAVIANLWDVTDRDINLFSKLVLQSWLQEDGPSDSDSVKEKMMRWKGCDNSSRGTKGGTGASTNRNRIASCMGKARDACRLRNLTGAAPVCYGVPTVLRKMKG